MITGRCTLHLLGQASHCVAMITLCAYLVGRVKLPSGGYDKEMLWFEYDYEPLWWL